jgi:hypothetical protein
VKTITPMYLRLGAAMLCLDCESIFAMANRCPACASETTVNLARLVNREPLVLSTAAANR